jgi:hypothetical protein
MPVKLAYMKASLFKQAVLKRWEPADLVHYYISHFTTGWHLFVRNGQVGLQTYLMPMPEMTGPL